MILTWILDRLSGKTNLGYRAWRRAVEREEERMRAEAPGGWETPRPGKPDAGKDKDE